MAIAIVEIHKTSLNSSKNKDFYLAASWRLRLPIAVYILTILVAGVLESPS
jgi:hypothetical protein